MKALTLWQPWAWCVIHGGKDIENRTWATRYRGPLLIHAARRADRDEYNFAASIIGHEIGIIVPAFDDVRRGQVEGVVTLVDIVTESDSDWFDGPFGWVLADPQPLPAVPVRGRQRLFNIDYAPIARAALGGNVE